jgi:two-component system, chemotaxis family, protein-glutamate methylesterase/glutaminase
MSRIIRILVVDDSAFARKVMKEILSHNPYVEVVGVARDGIEALEMVEEVKADLVTCDLMMPRLDGAGFVRKQMARRPIPILIVSVADENAGLALQALEAGAIDFVQKPTALATDDLFRIREELLEKVKAASRATPERLIATPLAREVHRPTRPRPASRAEVVVIGVSTGGPQALRSLLPRFPADFPVPVVMVLHMPIGFTALYAEKLDEICELEVREAAEGDELRPGLCLLAQAGMHLVLRKGRDGTVVTHLSREPDQSLHRPSVNALFQSAAEVYGERVLAVVMTGMGNDGKEGAAWVKAQGGTVLTEAEESCVIYGMPQAVVEAGLSDASIPLDRLAQGIIDRL